MSTHKAAGKAVQHKRPAGKRLGIKAEHGQKINSGAIIMRQRGTKLRAGKNVKVGRDHTLYAMVEGVVTFGQKMGRKIVSVV